MTDRTAVIGAGDVRGPPGPRNMAGFQLWVNLPARHKMTRPRYQEVPAARIPELEREGIRVKVIAGQVDGVRGPVTEIVADPTYEDQPVLRRLDPPAQRVCAAHCPWAHRVRRRTLPRPLPFEGQATFGVTQEGGGQIVRAPGLAVLGDGDAVEVRTAGQAVRFLLVSGLPLGEPIARWGPFVMNTREEIEQASRDLRNGTFVYGSRSLNH